MAVLHSDNYYINIAKWEYAIPKQKPNAHIMPCPLTNKTSTSKLILKTNISPKICNIEICSKLFRMFMTQITTSLLRNSNANTATTPTQSMK